MASEQDLVDQLCEICSIGPDKARFYLESSGWDVETALSLVEVEASEAEAAAAAVAAQPQVPQHPAMPPPGSTAFPPMGLPLGGGGGGGLHPMPLPPSPANQPTAPTWGASHPLPRAQPGPAPSSRPNPAPAPAPAAGRGGGAAPPAAGRGGKIGLGRSNVMNMADILGDDDDKSKTNFSGHGRGTAGTETFDDDEKMRQDFFERARRTAEASGGGGGGRGAAAPAPAGRKLGGPGSVVSAPGQVGRQAAPAGPPPRISIDVYKDAFTINGGEPRPLTDPAGRAFMEAIASGQMPRELMQQYAGHQEVETEVNRHDSKYVPPPKEFKAFSGAGRTLSGGSGSAAAPAAAAAATRPSAPAATGPAREPTVDESQPTTRVQLRLKDGQRKVVRLNQGRHTVGDLRRYAASVSPPGQAFQLLNGATRELLTDDSLTITQAQLENAVVMQS